MRSNSSSNGHDEKRAFIRMDVNAVVMFKPSQGVSQPHQGECRDLSGNGIRFNAETPVNTGSRLNVVVSVHEKFSPMEALIKVVRVEPHPNKTYDIAGAILNVIR